jgi:hypothetical protein
VIGRSQSRACSEVAGSILPGQGTAHRGDLWWERAGAWQGMGTGTAGELGETGRRVPHIFKYVSLSTVFIINRLLGLKIMKDPRFCLFCFCVLRQCLATLQAGLELASSLASARI